MFRDLASQVQRYLMADSSAIELEAWIVANTQQIMDSGDPRALYIANQIDADLIDLGEGLLDEAGFKTNLRRYFAMDETINLPDRDLAATTVTGSSSSPLEEVTIDSKRVRTDVFEPSFS